MKKLSTMLMLAAMLTLSAVVFASASGAQDAYPPNAEPPEEVVVPPTEVEGAVELNTGVEGAQLAFTGSSTGQTVRFALALTVIGASLMFVARTRDHKNAEA